MYKIIYPTTDACIYELYPNKNTGTDQIIELYSQKEGQPIDNFSYLDGTYNSRMLLKFDVSTLNSLISGREFKSYLTLRATEVEQVPYNYSIYAFALSGSWTNGTGFWNSNPEITNGVGWTNRTTVTNWLTSSYSSNVSGSWSSTPGGGNWYVNISASQQFNNESPDLRMDVSSIVRQWLTGSIQNDGFIVKFSDQDEQSSEILGKIQFFSVDTHTIYVPRLETYFNDVVLSGTGSFTEVGSDDQVVYIKNLKEVYNVNEKPLLRIGSRSRFPEQTYSTSSNYLIQKRLPVNSYYQIEDSVTYEKILPYDVMGTKVNCDSTGNYIKIDCESLMPERYYLIVFRCEYSDGTINIIDDKYLFRITRQ